MNDTKQQFGVMPMSTLGLLQQAKVMTMDYGQNIQNSWLQEQKESAALYGGLDLDGSDSGEPGMVELYLSTAYDQANEQAHASRLQAYSSFAQAGVSGFQAGTLAYVNSDSGLTKEQGELSGMKKSLDLQGNAVAMEEGAVPERRGNQSAGTRVMEGWEPKDDDILNDLKQGNTESFRALDEQQKKEFSDKLLDGDREDVRGALDKKDKQLTSDIKLDSDDKMMKGRFVDAVGTAANKLTDGIFKYFEAGAQEAASQLQASAQILKDAASQMEQTQESSKRQATQAFENTLQVAGWVLTQVQA